MGTRTVRLVHDLGGPEMVVPIEKRGLTLFVRFGDTSGWQVVDQRTGHVGSKKSKWNVHREDFEPFRQKTPVTKKRRF